MQELTPPMGNLYFPCWALGTVCQATEQRAGPLCVWKHNMGLLGRLSRDLQLKWKVQTFKTKRSNAEVGSRIKVLPHQLSKT